MNTSYSFITLTLAGCSILTGLLIHSALAGPLTFGGLAAGLFTLLNNNTTKKTLMRVITNEITSHTSSEVSRVIQDIEHEVEQTLNESRNESRNETKHHDPNELINECEPSISPSGYDSVSSIQKLHISNLIKEIHELHNQNSEHSDIDFEIHIKGPKHDEDLTYHDKNH